PVKFPGASRVLPVCHRSLNQCPLVRYRCAEYASERAYEGTCSESGNAMNVILNAITQFFVNIANGFLQGISGPFNDLIPLLGNTPLALTTANTVVEGTWTIMTGVADAFLGLIVVIAALQMLYGQSTGTLYIPLSQFVPKLILTVVLIHLSKILGQDLILLNNALCGLVRADVATFIQQANGGRPFNAGQNVGLATVLTIIASLSLIGIFLAIATFTLAAEIPLLLSRFSGAQGSPTGGIGTLIRTAMTAAILFAR